jgi:hypothetical protein
MVYTMVKEQRQRDFSKKSVSRKISMIQRNTVVNINDVVVGRMYKVFTHSDHPFIGRCTRKWAIGGGAVFVATRGPLRSLSQSAFVRAEPLDHVVISSDLPSELNEHINSFVGKTQKRKKSRRK